MKQFRKLSGFRKRGSEDRREPLSEQIESASIRAVSPSRRLSATGEASEFPPGGITRSLSAGTVDSAYSSAPNSVRGPDSGPLGLRVVYTPNNGHKADIVFVHGLGGTSRWTWSKNKNPELFWPLTFLALESDLCLARTLTYGYNSAFHKAGDGKTSVLDFAENLLHDLKYAEDDNNNNLNIGSVPLIFVAHSMGGLIVKEVCIQGSRRPEYENIINAVEALVFLATPHRGAQVAQLLNRILQSVIVSKGKQYVNDLLPTSFTLESQAESFRHIAKRFKLVSFYETQPTSIGLKNAKVMLLGKETSVLGYPDEISRALDADHHNVCKYNSRQDPNYLIVRSALRDLMRKVVQRTSANAPQRRASAEQPVDTTNPDILPDHGSVDSLKALLALKELPSEDLLFYRGQWKAGTCDWILDEQDYQDWSRTEQPSSRLLWNSGGAATGKSVLSSYVIKELEDRNSVVQYFFIRHGHPRKRTLSLLLRSIAYQLAQSSPDFLQRLITLKAENLDFEAMDAKSVWERLFRSILFRTEQTTPSFWVIDGLDEAENPRGFLELIQELLSSSPMIRVLITSRNTPELIAAFEPLSPATISLGSRLEDIRHFIRSEVLFTGSPELKEKLINTLMKRAENNFLFVKLVVAELNSLQNRSYDEMKQAIYGFQKGMDALYDRMARTIAQSSQQDKTMATKVLQCVNCANRALTVREMAQILGQELTHEDHFRASLIGVCSGFIIIEEGNDGKDESLGPRLAMIHQTAREYLFSTSDHPFKIDKRAAHAQMFQSCMATLMQPNDLKAKIRKNQAVEFLDYSASFWSYHLSMTPPGDSTVLETLRKFLTETKSNKEWVLIWIHYLASSARLRELPHTSKRLSDYAAKLKVNTFWQQDNNQQQIMQLYELLDNWAIDLIKISGKFGTVLLRNPRLIYKSIPPFCPRGSPIYQQFGQKEAKNLSVSGGLSSMEKWDDSLARMTFGTRVASTAVSAAGSQIAVLAPTGKVFMYDSSTFEQTTYSPFDNLERISHMALTSTGSLLASYGSEMTKIWEVSTGVCIVSANNLESRPRPHAMIFTNEDKTLLVAFDDRIVRALDLRESSPAWSEYAYIDEKELPGHFLNAPSHMALNPDGTRLAISYRGYPLSAWKLKPDGRPKHSGHCWRRGQSRKKRGEVEDLVWHPNYKLLLGVYSGGTVFKWRPGFKDSTSKRPRWEPKEISIGASKIAMSRDGQLFVTGDPRGTVKIYTTLGFHLLYHLASEDMIGGITFSPDTRRLYDTRGFYASAWEPTALVRWAEQIRGRAGSFDSVSETSVGHDSAVSVTWTPTLDALTVIATPASGSHIYCIGTASGGVSLQHTQRGKLVDIQVAKNLFGIETMAMSRHGKEVCFTDTIKTLGIASIAFDSKKPESVAVETQTEIHLGDTVKGAILDLVFHQDSTHILVQGSLSIHTISLDTLLVESSVELDATDMRWISHPHDKSRIIGLSTTMAYIYDWNLQPLHRYSLLHDTDALDSEFSMAESKVDRILPSTNGKYILVQVSPHGSQTSSAERSFYCVDVSLLPSSKIDPFRINRDPGIETIPVSSEVASQIGAALGFVKGNRLVFLSKSFSICFWQIDFSQISHQQAPVVITTDADVALDAPLSPDPSLQSSSSPGRRTSAGSILSSSSIRELFSLPGDWVSYDSLMVSTLWTREKSFLCPKGGEVAIVRTPELSVSKD